MNQVFRPYLDRLSLSSSTISLCTRKASWNMRDIGFGVADFKAIPAVCQVQQM